MTRGRCVCVCEDSVPTGLKVDIIILQMEAKFQDFSTSYCPK